MRYIIIAGVLLTTGCASTQRAYRQGFKDGFAVKTCEPFNYTQMPLYQGPNNDLIPAMPRSTSDRFKFQMDCRNEIGVAIACPSY